MEHGIKPSHVVKEVFLLRYRFEETEELDEVVDLLPDDVECYLRPSLANTRVGDIRISIQKTEDDVEQFWDEQHAVRVGHDEIGCS